MTYAGFWKRFLAWIIDSIILGVATGFLVFPALALVGVSVFATATADEPETGIGFIIAALGAYFMAIMCAAVGGWLYYALMESSERGATVGKMALGIKVTDLAGNKISFGKATGRYFGKIISGMILYIGFIMAGFTEKKQALHDMMAGCLVVNK